MREIKFRLFDLKEKKIKRVLSIEFETDNPDILREIHTYPIAIYSRNHPYTHSLNDIILMQYVCLKDKHKIEIYDRDILKYKDESGKEQIGIVKKIDCQWLVLALDGDEEGNQDLEIHTEYSNNFEIIGNIYENPELLNKEIRMPHETEFSDCSDGNSVGITAQ